MPASFTLGVIPGATPGKWLDTWQSRYPMTSVIIEQLEAADAVRRTAAWTPEHGGVEVAIVRADPHSDGRVRHDDLHAIALYTEVPVVVMSVDSDLTAAEELALADLTGEVLITPADDVLQFPLPDGVTAPRFAAPATTADAIEIVASGVGVVMVPMSLARLYHRKDVTFRPLIDGPSSDVSIVWHKDNASPAVEAFVGIVRGRTANSSR